jgi:hypothetical protein
VKNVVFFRVHDNGRHLRFAVNDPAKTTGRHGRDGQNAQQTSLVSIARCASSLLISRTNVLDGC